MAGIYVARERRLVPRWRPFKTSLALRELEPALRPQERARYPASSLASKRQAWRERRSASFAADYLAAAFVLDRKDDPEVLRAAECVLEAGEGFPEPARELARRALDLTEVEREGLEAPAGVSLDGMRKQVRVLRAGLVAEPRNAFLWTDLALAYTVLGEQEKAIEKIGVALSLAPANRFVVRSASRLLVHCGESERAHDLLVRSELVRTDPWVLAAELATALVAGKSSRSVRRAREIVSNGVHSPFHLSELAGALASLEIEAGGGLRAKRLFRKSLEEPTENAVAQATWAWKEVGGPAVPNQKLSTPRSFEARASEYFFREQWEGAYRESLQWLRDEPFSSRAAEFGSYVASVALQNHRMAVEICRLGVRASADVFGIRNNLVFALGNLGRLDEALAEFVKLERLALTKREGVVRTATAGLLEYRKGDVVRGRQLYDEAIAEARRLGDKRLVALAASFGALEALRTGEPGGRELRAVAEEASKGLGHSDLRLLVRRIDAQRETEG